MLRLQEESQDLDHSSDPDTRNLGNLNPIYTVSTHTTKLRNGPITITTYRTFIISNKNIIT